MPREATPHESILLVDDNPTNLQVLYQTLLETGCKLQAAKDGQTAVNIARKAQPNLILLDIMMPVMDGYDVCRRLKDDPATRDIPVVFLTALSDIQDKVKGFNVGAVDYITKPFQPQEVLARVNTHLTLNRLRLEVADQKKQLELELKTVSALQRDLLPANLPAIEGLDLAAYYETSRYAGGDYYDFSGLPDGRWNIFMADAEGHSSPAAVHMAMTCTLYRAYPGLPDDPSAVLDYLNGHLCKSITSGSFLTGLCLVYTPNERLLHMASAGHPPPMLYSASSKKATVVDCPCVYPLGIKPYSRIPSVNIRLNSGDRLLIYTDGIQERFNPREEIYGARRMLDRLETAPAGSAKETLEWLMTDVEQFADGLSSDDDQAALVAVVK